MAPVSVRYIVDDVDAAILFWTGPLGFGVDKHPAPTFAILSRGHLCLLLSAPSGPGGGAQPMPYGDLDRVSTSSGNLQFLRGAGSLAHPSYPEPNASPRIRST
jgi:catechol 2,3-dioxygenase-like lactoylglutathione lyase family enzyme